MITCQLRLPFRGPYQRNIWTVGVTADMEQMMHDRSMPWKHCKYSPFNIVGDLARGDKIYIVFGEG